MERGLEDPTKNNFHLATTLRGIRRSKGCTVSQKQPMTPAMVLAIKSHLNLTDPVHATFWAVCLTGFFGLLRKANMLLKGVAKFNPVKHLGRSDIVFHTGWATVINRWSKTIQFSQRLLTVPLPLIPGHPLCPYSALQHAFKLVPATLSGPAFVLPAPYLTSAVRTKEVLTAEVKYSSRQIALKTAQDSQNNMTDDSVNIFFKLLLKNLL